MEFWDRVKTLIKSKNITQEGLAKAAEINFSNMKQMKSSNNKAEQTESRRNEV